MDTPPLLHLFLFFFSFFSHLLLSNFRQTPNGLPFFLNKFPSPFLFHPTGDIAHWPHLSRGMGGITTDCPLSLALLTEPHVGHCTSWTVDSSQRATSSLIGPENEQEVVALSASAVPT
jgi:hypothetical protein